MEGEDGDVPRPLSWDACSHWLKDDIEGNVGVCRHRGSRCHMELSQEKHDLPARCTY